LVGGGAGKDGGRNFGTRYRVAKTSRTERYRDFRGAEHGPRRVKRDAKGASGMGMPATLMRRMLGPMKSFAQCRNGIAAEMAVGDEMMGMLGRIGSQSLDVDRDDERDQNLDDEGYRPHPGAKAAIARQSVHLTSHRVKAQIDCDNLAILRDKHRTGQGSRRSATFWHRNQG
jgi:hypothetical protein